MANVPYYAGSELKLNCTLPSVYFAKTPIVYTHKHFTAAEFSTKDCKVEKVFGEEIEEVLMDLDHEIDLRSSFKAVSDKFQASLADMDFNAKKLEMQVRSFIDELPVDTAQIVSQFDEGTVDSAFMLADSIKNFDPQGALQTLQSIPKAIGTGGWEVNYKSTEQ